MQDRPVLDMNIDYEAFFRVKVLTIVHSVKGDESPLWGLMTAHHMLEHLVFPLNFALNVLIPPVITPVERLPKLIAFLESEFGLVKNFQAPFLPVDELPPLMTKSLEEAKQILLERVHLFITEVTKAEYVQGTHPVFGKLDNQHWLMFQYKHFHHHFTQFGLV